MADVSAIAFQFGDSSIWSILLLIMLLLLYPKLYIWQMIFALETKMRELEHYAKTARKFVIRKISLHPTAKLRSSIDRFMDFFVIEPVSLDPYGIIRKLEHVINESERRFDYFVEQICPATFSKIEKRNVKFGLMGAISVNQIFKIIRHYVITIKKTGNLQLAMLLQMIMPILMKIAKAEVKATDAFIKGIPIGDAIGPLVAAQLKTKPGKEMAKDVLVSQEKVAGKKVQIMKAVGPGGALGKLGSAVEKIAKKRAVDHMITIDAAGKLEGEKTGSVAEGIGVAVGGPGVERYKIEEVAVKYAIPLDSVVIKEAPEEAPIPLKKEIFAAVEPTIEIVNRLVKESKHKKILIVGVGNSCGIANTKKEVVGLDKKLKPIWQQQAREEEEEKKKLKLFGKKY